jgi:5-methylcytosine-specific restriction endonuclease McrA
MASSPIDWTAVRADYEAGWTRGECQAKHGFSNGAWNRAVGRGEIVPRPRSSGRRAQDKREAIAELKAAGMSYSQIARELGMTKSTVAYHARRLGIPVDETASRRYDWVAVQTAYDSGLTVRECAAKFGFCLASWTAAVKRGAIIPRSKALPLEELLVVGRPTNRVHLKNRLIAAGLKENRCEREGCGISDWHGEPLSLQLHHRNGDGTDNRLENLQLLCANCHSQTDTYGGRNGHRRPRNGTIPLAPGRVQTGDQPPAVDELGDKRAKADDLPERRRRAA